MKYLTLFIFLTAGTLAKASCIDIEEKDSLYQCLQTHHSVAVLDWSFGELNDQQVLSGMKSVARLYHNQPELREKEFRVIGIGTRFFPVQDRIGVEPDPTLDWDASPSQMLSFLREQKTYPQLVRRNDALLQDITDLEIEISRVSGIEDVRCLRRVRDNYDCRNALRAILEVVKDYDGQFDASQLLVGNDFEVESSRNRFFVKARSLDTEIRQFIATNIPLKASITGPENLNHELGTSRTIR